MATEAQPPTRLDRRTRAARAEEGDARERLLAAAAKIFAKRGYRAASVDDVAAEAGFSKGAVYWHFGSKEDLLHALIDEPVRDRTEAMLARMVEAPPEEDMGREVGGRYMEMLRDERELVLLSHEYWSLAVREPKLRKRLARLQAERRAELAEALRVRQEHLGTPDLDMPTEQSATAFLALANGLAMDALLDPEAVPATLYGQILSLVYDGLVARAERSARG
jgi:AcrR family transcriptional regulator